MTDTDEMVTFKDMFTSLQRGRPSPAMEPNFQTRAVSLAVVGGAGRAATASQAYPADLSRTAGTKRGRILTANDAGVQPSAHNPCNKPAGQALLLADAA